MPNVFQNSFCSTREAAPLEELEPELFLKEPELCQTNPKCQFFMVICAPFFVDYKQEEMQQNKILNESLQDEYNNNQQHFKLKLTK